LVDSGKAADGGRRAGSTILIRLARPAGYATVQALARRPMRLGELAKELDGPSKATVRARLDDLVALGAVAKRGGGMPYAVHNELTGVGRDLLQVVDSVDAWLSRAPKEPIPLGSAAVKRAVKALVGGWDSTMLDAFAAGPQSLTGLAGTIDGLNYRALERRLAALRSADLVESAPSGVVRFSRIGRWGREGTGPLLTAARFERTHMAEGTAPLTPADEGTLSLLAPGT
jgi:DNA-binding HxlR family transcriptional regulator